MKTTERAVPENTIEPGTDLPPPPQQHGFDPHALLAEQLERCHRAAMKCFDLCECEDDEDIVYRDTRGDFLTMAAKMMKTSLALTAALQKRQGTNETRRHVIVEHVVTPTPPPNSKNRKTNSGGRDIESTHG